MTTSMAKAAGMLPFRMAITSTIYTTVTSIDGTTITTTNASPPASMRCMRPTTMFMAMAVAMWRSRMAITSTTSTTAADTHLTATTTTSTNAGLFTSHVNVELTAAAGLL
jgi:hypothetical protein